MTATQTELEIAHQRLIRATDGMLLRVEKFRRITPKTDQDGWNPSEVIQHLTISEKGILGYVKKKTSSGWLGLEEATDDTKLRGKILLEKLASNEKYTAPEFIAQPDAKITLNEAISEWIRNRTELIDYFNTAPSNALNLLVFRQPAAGMLTLTQTIDFIASHIEHHYQQIDSFSV